MAPALGMRKIGLKLIADKIIGQTAGRQAAAWPVR